MNHDSVFECPHCGQWLEAPVDMAGLFVECPKCEAIIKVPREGEKPELKGQGKKLPEEVPPPEDDALKGSTIRIQLPPNLGLPPEKPRRKFIIRRKNP
ncbi:MAG TPA: hypothetical protein PJ991_04580 [Kiritimatiellia bacterium]|nr:hypothetical protein [Kiritimatiellia bacterium]